MADDPSRDRLLAHLQGNTAARLAEKIAASPQAAEPPPGEPTPDECNSGLSDLPTPLWNALHEWREAHSDAYGSDSDDKADDVWVRFRAAVARVNREVERLRASASSADGPPDWMERIEYAEMSDRPRAAEPSTERAKCDLCGEPMPEGEEMFIYHGYSGPCPARPVAGGWAWPSDWPATVRDAADVLYQCRFPRSGARIAAIDALVRSLSAEIALLRANCGDLLEENVRLQAGASGAPAGSAPEPSEAAAPEGE